MTIISRKKRNNWRYQLGAANHAESWRLLFHRSANAGYEQTKTALKALLSYTGTFTDEILTGIKDRYIADCETASRYDWRYYFIKYASFRPNSYRKYSWLNYRKKPYELSVMQTRLYWSENTYSPFLKEIDAEHLSREDKGQRIKRDNWYMEHHNHAYIIYSLESGEEIRRISIDQSPDGIDTENRIIKMKKLYPEILANTVR